MQLLVYLNFISAISGHLLESSSDDTRKSLSNDDAISEDQRPFLSKEQRYQSQYAETYSTIVPAQEWSDIETIPSGERAKTQPNKLNDPIVLRPTHVEGEYSSWVPFLIKLHSKEIASSINSPTGHYVQSDSLPKDPHLPLFPNGYPSVASSIAIPKPFSKPQDDLPESEEPDSYKGWTYRGLTTEQIREMFHINKNNREITSIGEFEDHKDGNVNHWRMLPINDIVVFPQFNDLVGYFNGQVRTKTMQFLNWNWAVSPDGVGKDQFLLWCPWQEVLLVACNQQKKYKIREFKEKDNRRYYEMKGDFDWSSTGEIAPESVDLSCVRSQPKARKTFGLEGDPVKMLTSNTRLQSAICLVSIKATSGKWKGLPARLRRQSNDGDVNANFSGELVGAPNVLSGGSSNDVKIYVDELVDEASTSGVDVSVSELNVSSPDMRPVQNMSEVNLADMDNMSTHSSLSVKKFVELSRFSSTSTPYPFSAPRHGINQVFENSRSSARKPGHSTGIGRVRYNYQRKEEMRRNKVSVLGLFELSTRTGTRPEGQSELAAAQMAIKHINDRSLLPGYTLELLTNDTKVSDRLELFI